MANHLINFTA